MKRETRVAFAEDMELVMLRCRQRANPGSVEHRIFAVICEELNRRVRELRKKEEDE
jgi:hypothetical protein